MDPEPINRFADLPDAQAAERFLKNLGEKHPRQLQKLLSKPSLLLDIATIAAFSPFLSATLLQDPEHMWWLERRRADSGVRSRDDLLQSLGQFSMTNSALDTTAIFARFRRRELLRIYLRDIRRLATISEITEEISNLADAILEFALQLAIREIDNRYGPPLESDPAGRLIPARICIAALGKLGSRELNYSSDIDLLFLYSGEGSTSGTGSRGAATNREYFVKVAELTTKLVSGQSTDGSAYRVDLRLRPHGTLGPLAISVADMTAYYTSDARAWERQVLIRSRGCAGHADLFRLFFRSVESTVFSSDETVETALANVRLSKEKIDVEQRNRRGFDVKIGRGGIREIEFLAQALQLAHGGRDPWLRSPHTLISLARLAERHYISGSELSELSAAYDFLRRTEHVLQMENGVQTHVVPDEPGKREALAQRMQFATGSDFETGLRSHTENVSRVYARVFGEPPAATADNAPAESEEASDPWLAHISASLSKAGIELPKDSDSWRVVETITSVSPHFAGILAANPELVPELIRPEVAAAEPDYESLLLHAVRGANSFREALSSLRRRWSRALLEIVVADIYGTATPQTSKHLQTLLAEAAIAAALLAVRDEMARRHGNDGISLHLAVLALGKLGGKALDYDSDLDLLLVYDDRVGCPVSESTNAEFYSRVVGLFVNALSSVTRDGHLYRVDLRLRPYGSKGLSSMPSGAFLQYMTETADIWEMLAFVKLRAVGGDLGLARYVEENTRAVIHRRGAETGDARLRLETARVRAALEKQRARIRRQGDIDIKYGPGGLLDVYFVTRYLQLRENLPDDETDRSTTAVLRKLKKNNVLTDDNYRALVSGYEFLSDLDHALRLTIGRTTRLPAGDKTSLRLVAARLDSSSPESLIEQLTVHRLEVRSVFDEILANN